MQWPADGYTGEFQVKSYLIGDLHCDWLDEEEDLIHTDRQNIQWSSDVGTAFREWGGQSRRPNVIPALSRDPP